MPTISASNTRKHSTVPGSPRSSERRRTATIPTHGATAAGRRAEANITRKRQAQDWDEQHGKLVDLSGFERDILPLIQDVLLSRLQKVTGLSLRYVSLIRRGDRTPHPRHWQTLIEAADGRAQFVGDAEALAKRDS